MLLAGHDPIALRKMQLYLCMLNHWANARHFSGVVGGWGVGAGGGGSGEPALCL